MKGSSIYLNYTILSSDENSNWPASNLKIISSSTQAWRSPDTTESEIIIDLGGAKQDPTIGIYRANFDSVTIQGNTSDAWGSPAFSQVYSTSYDPEHFIYKLRKALGASFNYRYLRVLVTAQTPNDQASYFEAGVIFIAESGNLEDFNAEPLSTFQHPLGMTTKPQETIEPYETGRFDIFPDHDIPTSELSLPGHFLNNEANRTKVPKVFNHPLRSIIYLDFETEFEWEWYLLQRTGAGLRNDKSSPRSRLINLNLRTIL